MHRPRVGVSRRIMKRLGLTGNMVAGGGALQENPDVHTPAVCSRQHAHKRKKDFVLCSVAAVSFSFIWQEDKPLRCFCACACMRTYECMCVYPSCGD